MLREYGQQANREKPILDPKVYESAFNKIGDALDISHVQMARYLGAAEKALAAAKGADRDAARAKLECVVLVPEAGDTIQVMKAGLLEIANVFVVNKADRDDPNDSNGQ